MAKALVNGNEYSDDGTATRDMLNGGHRTWLVPLLQDIVTTVAAINGLGVTSTTARTIGAGSHTFVVTPTTTIYNTNALVKAVSVADGTKYMIGQVTASTAGSLTISVSSGFTGGSGSVSDWIITPYNQAPIPSQASNAGKALFTDGSILSWLAAARLDLAQAWTKGQRGSEVNVAYAATVTLDLNAGNKFNIGDNSGVGVIAGNLTIANPDNLAAGQSFRIRAKMNGTGGYTLSLGNKFKAKNGTVQTWDNTAGALNMIYCESYLDSDGTTLLIEYTISQKVS